METPVSQAQPVEAVRTALPVLVDLHMGLEVDLRAEEGFEFRAERVQGRRILTVRITPKESEPAESTAT